LEVRGLKIKLDENLSRHLAPVLSQFGHDVDTAADEGLLSRPDAEIAAAASRDGRLLMTLDLDFSDIRRFPPGSHPGIVVFRPREEAGPLEINRFVESFVRTNDIERLARCLAVVTTARLRVRKPEAASQGESSPAD
jgi:predicted nuclease of predicted toxin-antitoxin system